MWNCPLTAPNTMIRNPTIRMHLSTENRTPSSLLSQPSIIIFIVFSRIFPNANSPNTTAMNIRANAMIFSSCGDASIHCPIHRPAMTANFTESHTPRTRDMIAITWAMNPLRRPLITAGMKHSSSIMSRIFIIFAPCFRNCCKIIQKI